MKRTLILLLPAFTSMLHAQVFDPAEGAGTPDNNGSGNTTIINPGPKTSNKPFVGQDMPFLDPGSETAQWDGRMWNVANNRLFRARFEKFLAAPDENSARDQAYRDLLLAATKALSPSHPGGPSIPECMRAMVKAADTPIDARLCDSIAQAVYAVVLSRKNTRLLDAMNKAMEKERHNLGWNIEVTADAAEARRKLSEPAGKPGETKPAPIEKEVADMTRAGTYIKKIVEIDATRLTNAAKMTASELKAKVEFQALIVQLFLQRRFEHVILSCRLYRALNEDGDNELKLKQGSDVDKMFTRTTGTTPTVTALDALSNETIRDVDEGVQSFDYLVEKGDLESASKRLSESFIVGEYLPRMRTLKRLQKAKVLNFVRDTNQLISAIEVKDYTLAEELVNKLKETSKDFDFSKPRAAIETARSTSALHIMSARSAAISKDDKKVAEEIRNAAEIWPTNPDLKAFSTQIASYGDMHSRILGNLDSLLAQKNYRLIATDMVKYSGAVLGKPDYEQKLKAALEKVARVDRAVATAQEMEKGGDSAGAWERLKEISPDFPEDNDVNRLLMTLSEKNPEFIHALEEAKKQEAANRTGISLSWYLKAKRIYPNSLAAKAGINRLASRILPDGNSAQDSTPEADTAPAAAERGKASNPF